MDMYLSGKGDDLNSRNELYIIYLFLCVLSKSKRHTVKDTFCLLSGVLYRRFDFQLSCSRGQSLVLRFVHCSAAHASSRNCAYASMTWDRASGGYVEVDSCLTLGRGRLSEPGKA